MGPGLGSSKVLGLALPASPDEYRDRQVLSRHKGGTDVDLTFESVYLSRSEAYINVPQLTKEHVKIQQVVRGRLPPGKEGVRHSRSTRLPYKCIKVGHEYSKARKEERIGDMVHTKRETGLRKVLELGESHNARGWLRVEKFEQTSTTVIIPASTGPLVIYTCFEVRLSGVHTSLLHPASPLSGSSRGLPARGKRQKQQKD